MPLTQPLVQTDDRTRQLSAACFALLELSVSWLKTPSDLHLFHVWSQFRHRLVPHPAPAGLLEVSDAGVSPGGGGWIPERRTRPTAVGAERWTTCGHIWTEGTEICVFTAQK